MRRIIDISLPVSPAMLTWPKDPAVEVLPARRISSGDGANVSELRLGTHTGTHVDPPVHFIEGAPTIDEIDLDRLIGPAIVADFTGVEGEITEADLAGLELDAESRLLCKTSNSEIWSDPSPSFPGRYVALSGGAAARLARLGIRLVGIDFLSVETRGAPGHPAHTALLGAGVPIIEGLDLRAVAPGNYELVCLPLRIAGGDGAPARAVLIQ